MDNRPIGMFDSGVGGLTVYREVKKLMPNEKIIYMGDTKRFPYGSKTKETIIDASKRCIEFLISKNVKMIVIACGTATSQALEEVKKLYSIPIIGIIEPTVNYIKEKEYKNVGVIATRGTIRSESWETNLKKQILDVNVYNQECPLLASMAEEGWTENEIAKLTLQEYLKNLTKIDSLILGCTHYPLFEKLIKEIKPGVDIINTGKIVANYIEQKLKEEQSNNIQSDEFYLTDIECNFKMVAEKILNTKVIINYQEIN